MSQSAAQRVDKRRGQTFPLSLEHAQVGEEVGLGTGPFPGNAMVYFGFTVEQGTYVHEDVEDLILALPDFVTIGGAILAPCSEELTAACRVYVKSKHQLPELLEVLMAARRSGVAPLRSL